jgi:hypothetical protein|tara:strand:- start:1112 stop:1441 length:330 start_codon:yes stop_codon:yes gene_type:complete
MRILIALIMCLLPVASLAEQSVFNLTTKHICGPKVKTEKILLDNRYIPFVKADAIVQHIDGEDLASIMNVYVNPDNWAFVIIIANPKDTIWCILTEGKNFMAMVPGESI